jgi:hypothetical protein
MESKKWEKKSQGGSAPKQFINNTMPWKICAGKLNL